MCKDLNSFHVVSIQILLFILLILWRIIVDYQIMNLLIELDVICVWDQCKTIEYVHKLYLQSSQINGDMEKSLTILQKEAS